MRQIIKENKMENIIKEYILSNYDVVDVQFTTENIYLGSGDVEDRNIERNVINVYIDNVFSKKSRAQMKNIKSKLWDSLSGLFNLDFVEYAAKWGLVVYQIKREEI